VLGSFWEGIGGRLADRWAAVSVPALIFWLGGLLAWAYSRGGLHQLSTLSGWLDRQSTPAQVAVLITVLLGVGASGLIVQRFTTSVLRLLEGYWPAALDPLRRQLIEHKRRRSVADETAWQELAPQVLSPHATPTADQLSEFARLDQLRHRRPSRSNRLMPTRIGNILRAAETMPADKYGLDAVAVWPRLWLTLPDTTRQELLAARSALDSAVGAVAWGLLFCAFTTWSWLALPIGLIIAAAAVTVWVPARSEVFADLLESTYDLHRTALYQQLRWPLPTNPEQERQSGQQLTAYLWRGSDEPNPTFTAPK
jgi:hypothetical protein